MEHTTYRAPAPEVWNDADEQRFAAVWERVRAAQQGGPEAQRSPAAPPGNLETTPGEDALARRTAPTPPQTIQQPPAGADTERQALLLRHFVLMELDAHLFYTRFAVRVHGKKPEGSLTDIAEDGQRHIRRLLAAHYLLTGRSYQPRFQPISCPLPEYREGLRVKFEEKKRSALEYARAAEETEDRCMRELFQELAEEEHDHARLLQALMEAAVL